MPRIIGLSGSLRRASFNTALLKTAAGLMPQGSDLEIATLHGIPLYDADTEAAEGVPAVVAELKDRIAAADGWILATPEYNNAMPGVAKNAIDWLSRPPSDIGRVFRGRPMALLGASPGGFGTVMGQNAWLPVMRTLGVPVWPGGRLMVSRASTLFDDQGRLTDDKTREALQAFLAGFVAWVATARSGA